MGILADERPREQVSEAIGSSIGAEEFFAQIGGSLKCWGMNGYGMVGDGTTSNRNTPVQS